MPPAIIAAIPLIMQGIQVAISIAPGVIDVVTKSKAMITALFEAKKIPVEVQNALHATVDSIAVLVDAGITPPNWTVEPDPVTAPKA